MRSLLVLLVLRAAALAATNVYKNPVDFASSAPRLSIGDPAPALNVTEWVKGQPIPKFARGTAYVVEFWASWCKPCQKSIAGLSRLERRYGRRGLRVIGVAAAEQDGPERLRALVRSKGEAISYAVAYVEQEGAYERW